MIKRIFIALFVVRRERVYEKNEYSLLFNEELSDMYYSTNIIQVIKPRKIMWACYLACVEGRRGAYEVLVGLTQGKRPLGRPRNRREHTKMDLQEVVFEGID